MTKRPGWNAIKNSPAIRGRNGTPGRETFLLAPGTRLVETDRAKTYDPHFERFDVTCAKHETAREVVKNRARLHRSRVLRSFENGSVMPSTRMSLLL